jgi:hypothetical protein
MNRRGMMLAFLLYLTLDLSSPFVPGAFNFDPDECVDGIRRASSSHERADATALPARSPVAPLVCPQTSPVRPPAGGRHAVLEWLVDSREDSRASGDLPVPSEDH